MLNPEMLPRLQQLIADADLDAAVTRKVKPAGELAALENCLQKLPERQRVLVEERYQHGATVRATGKCR